MKPSTGTQAWPKVGAKAEPGNIGSRSSTLAHLWRSSATRKLPSPSRSRNHQSTFAPRAKGWNASGGAAVARGLLDHRRSTFQAAHVEEPGLLEDLADGGLAAVRVRRLPLAPHGGEEPRGHGRVERSPLHEHAEVAVVGAAQNHHLCIHLP